MQICSTSDKARSLDVMKKKVSYGLLENKKGKKIVLMINNHGSWHALLNAWISKYEHNNILRRWSRITELARTGRKLNKRIHVWKNKYVDGHVDSNEKGMIRMFPNIKTCYLKKHMCVKRMLWKQTQMRHFACIGLGTWSLMSEKLCEGDRHVFLCSVRWAWKCSSAGNSEPAATIS